MFKNLLILYRFGKYKNNTYIYGFLKYKKTRSHEANILNIRYMKYQDKVNHIPDDITCTYITVRVMCEDLLSVFPLEWIYTCILLRPFLRVLILLEDGSNVVLSSARNWATQFQ